MNSLYIQKAQLVSNPRDPKKFFNFKKYIIDVLVELGLMAADPCCNNGFVPNSIETSITATGTSQGTGRALTAQYNIITTATTSNYSVILPPAKKNMMVHVLNSDGSGSDPIRVYAASGNSYYGTLNGYATVAYAKNVIFVCNQDGNWISILLNP
jgi:hypothetical protein